MNLGGALTGAVGGAGAGFAVGGPIGAAVGGVLGGVGSALSGGGSTTQSGYTLPPEYELQYIQQFQQQMEQMQQDYQSIGAASEAYNTKVNALNDIISNGYKPEAFQAIQQSNFQLGQALGMNAQDLVKNGFITSEDHKNLSEMEKVAAGNYNQVQNPVLEGQLGEQRRQLEQDLARSGVSPQQRAIALNQFEQSANEQRYGQAQQQFGLYGQLINQRAGLRQQGFGQAGQTLGYGMQQANQYMQGYQQLGQNYNNQNQNVYNMLQAQQGLRQEGQQGFTTMGQFKFSKQTKGLLQSGAIGPGSIYGQTGIAGKDATNYGKYISGQEANQFRADNPAYNSWRKAQGGGWGLGSIGGAFSSLGSVVSGGMTNVAGSIASGNFGGALYNAVEPTKGIGKVFTRI